MPSGSYKQFYVQCPFYEHDNGKSNITCEGIFPDSTQTHKFRYKKDYEMQINTFCCKYYEKCEVHRMLTKYKYEEE